MEVDEGQLYKDVGAALLVCLVGRGFRVYPKHRWQGADVAVDLTGLALCTHGLGVHAFKHMVGLVSSHLDPASTTTAAHNHPPLPSTGAVPGASAPSRVQPQDGPEVAQLQEVDFEEGGQRGGDLGGADPNQQDWAHLAAMNARSRKLALAWLQQDAMPHLMAIRLLLSPLCKLLSHYITRSGHAWSEQQQALTAH